MSRLSGFLISFDLRRKHNAKLAEDLSQEPLIYVFRQVSHKDLSPNFLSSLILTCFVYLDWLVEKFDHMKDLN